MNGKKNHLGSLVSYEIAKRGESVAEKKWTAVLYSEGHFTPEDLEAECPAERVVPVLVYQRANGGKKKLPVFTNPNALDMFCRMNSHLKLQGVLILNAGNMAAAERQGLVVEEIDTAIELGTPRSRTVVEAFPLETNYSVTTKRIDRMTTLTPDDKNGKT